MNLNRAQPGLLAAALLLIVAAFPAGAQQQPAAEATVWAARPAVSVSEQQTDAEARGGEPNVRRTVIEDNGSKIEELRIRGQTQRITVTPKIGPKKRYDIITGDASRDSTYGTGGARDAVGKRVWDVLDF